jgi:predicted nucleotide-binding protein (sugar kinase/HSP70/actin superfamily)
MKVTFPHMGHLYITARAVLEGFGLEVIVPPFITKKTLSLGTQNAPEFACLPLKVNLGNYLEAAALGADTIVMGGGVGPCRFGYYAQVQREILQDMHCDLEMVVLEPPDAHFSELINKIKYLARKPWRDCFQGLRIGWWKAKAVDALERKVQWLRPREKIFGVADKIFDKAKIAIDGAQTRQAIRVAYQQAEMELAAVPVDPEKEICRIALVGEIYTVLEPFVNLHVERHLGKMGVEVNRSLYLSDWINEHLFNGLLIRKQNYKERRALAEPYLNHFVGGHGLETVADTVYYARQQFDGVIQLAPLTCMPEIVAESILPTVSSEMNIPTMTVFLDEQTGEAGLVTRLEAFVDMINRRKMLKDLDKEKVV